MRSHPALAALLPAIAGIGAALALAGGSDWSEPRTLLAALVGAVIAATVGALLLGPVFRRHAHWKDRLDVVSRRLQDLESGRRPATDDAVRTISELSLPGNTEDEGLDDALAGLEAALTDEKRLRERRSAVQDRVTVTLNRGRELAATDGDTGGELDRLASRLGDLEASVREARDAGDSTLARSIACDEVARLLEGHVRTNRDAGRRATSDTEDLHGQIEIVTKLVRRLEARSREIGEVLLVLNDITEQTSLLALNAAIIAAQAGEQGKGFGVVADEMRNLSERAFSSTKETEMLAQTLRDDVGQAVRSMTDASDTVRGLRAALGEASESGSVLTEVGSRTAETARTALHDAERQAEALREVDGHLRTLAEQRARLARLEKETLLPARHALAEATGLLEDQWQAGALRDSLRRRLADAVGAIRDRRGRDRHDREELENRLGTLRESGRRFAEALEETRRRDDVVREISRSIRDLALPASGR